MSATVIEIQASPAIIRRIRDEIEAAKSRWINHPYVAVEPGSDMYKYLLIPSSFTAIGKMEWQWREEKKMKHLSVIAKSLLAGRRVLLGSEWFYLLK